MGGPAVSGGLVVDCEGARVDLVPRLTGLDVIAVRGHHLPIEARPRPRSTTAVHAGSGG